MLADTLYTGDENVQAAAARGVDLVGPVPGRAPEADPEAMTVDDFGWDERTGAIEPAPQVTGRSCSSGTRQRHGRESRCPLRLL